MFVVAFVAAAAVAVVEALWVRPCDSKSFDMVIENNPSCCLCASLREDEKVVTKKSRLGYNFRTWNGSTLRVCFFR